MASRRNQVQEEVKFRVLRLLNDNPNMTTRKIANIVGISNGSAYYCINALIEKGMIKLKSFSNHKKKSKYAYILTPSGIYEKTILTAKFLQTKLEEYENLKNQIQELEKEVKIAKNDVKFRNNEYK